MEEQPKRKRHVFGRRRFTVGDQKYTFSLTNEGVVIRKWHCPARLDICVSAEQILDMMKPDAPDAPRNQGYFTWPKKS